MGSGKRRLAGGVTDSNAVLGLGSRVEVRKEKVSVAVRGNDET